LHGTQFFFYIVISFSGLFIQFYYHEKYLFSKLVFAVVTSDVSTDAGNFSEVLRLVKFWNVVNDIEENVFISQTVSRHYPLPHLLQAFD
jgi:hypothetical protein